MESVGQNKSNDRPAIRARHEETARQREREESAKSRRNFRKRITPGLLMLLAGLAMFFLSISAILFTWPEGVVTQEMKEALTSNSAMISVQGDRGDQGCLQATSGPFDITKPGDVSNDGRALPPYRTSQCDLPFRTRTQMLADTANLAWTPLIWAGISFIGSATGHKQSVRWWLRGAGAVTWIILFFILRSVWKREFTLIGAAVPGKGIVIGISVVDRTVAEFIYSSMLAIAVTGIADAVQAWMEHQQRG